MGSAERGQDTGRAGERSRTEGDREQRRGASSSTGATRGLVPGSEQSLPPTSDSPQDLLLHPLPTSAALGSATARGLGTPERPQPSAPLPSRSSPRAGRRRAPGRRARPDPTDSDEGLGRGAGPPLAGRGAGLPGGCHASQPWGIWGSRRPRAAAAAAAALRTRSGRLPGAACAGGARLPPPLPGRSRPAPHPPGARRPAPVAHPWRRTTHDRPGAHPSSGPRALLGPHPPQPPDLSAPPSL